MSYIDNFKGQDTPDWETIAEKTPQLLRATIDKYASRTYEAGVEKGKLTPVVQIDWQAPDLAKLKQQAVSDTLKRVQEMIEKMKSSYRGQQYRYGMEVIEDLLYSLNKLQNND